MAQPYVGEIRMFAGNFPPVGWMFCDGASLSIAENETLFNLIGTTYGGDGQSTFNLPDLQGRLPMHMGTGPTGQSYIIGQKAGEEAVTLTTNQIPAHNHAFLASTDIATQKTASGNVVAQSTAIKLFTQEAPFANMNPNSVASSGGSQPHDNMQPFLCINFIISLFGIFPSPT